MTLEVPQTVLVSGACGLLGSAIVESLARLGVTVLAVDINQSGLEALVSAYGHESIRPLSVDLTSEQGFNALAQYLDTWPSVTGAVHAAYPRSLGWGTHFEELDSQHLFADLSAQLGGAILFSKVVLQHFKHHGGGTLIHLSSIQGISAPKFEHYAGTSMYSPVEYAAIKAGVISITRWLAKYYDNSGIRVNCISPGGIFDHQPDSFIDKYRQDCTNIGMLTPDHIVSAVHFLLSRQSIAINGQNLVIDDGWTL